MSRCQKVCKELGDDLRIGPFDSVCEHLSFRNLADEVLGIQLSETSFSHHLCLPIQIGRIDG